jgi:translation initiation factor IF-3
MEVSDIRKREPLMNEGIKDKEVRLIDEDGSMIGIVPLEEAQRLAEAKDLDLVVIASNATPTVCKITDYSKNEFERSKREKEARKKQKQVSLKEVRLSATIEEHDFEFKMKNACKFLQSGSKVKVSIRFKGREMRYTTIGQEVLDKFAQAVKEVGTVEKQPKLEGRSMTMILVPVPATK